MQGSLIALGVIALAWCLCSTLLERVYLRTPLVMTGAGMVVGLFTHGRLADVLESGLTTTVAEIVLAVLLFVDATEVRRGRLLGSDLGAVTRLLALALPVSIAAGLAVGVGLLPYLSWAAVLVLACAVVPIDFASAETLLRDRRLPRNVREVVNIEGGYNDGIVSPVFAYALLLAGTVGGGHEEGPAVGAVQAVVIAVLVGSSAGTATGWLLARAQQLGWTSPQSSTIAILVLPVLVYAVAVVASGNGFVAAFVCGVTFRQVHRRHRPHDSRASAADDHRLLDDVTSLLSIAMWFVFGNVVVLVLTSGYVDLPVIVFSLAVLTVVRAAPVLIALVGSSLSPRERLMVGVIGPRGTTSIVFGLLAFNQLADPTEAYTVLGVTALVVFGSVLLHGLAMPIVLERRPRRTTGVA
ncbi:NhaP-type Na+/H+ or K+/H+ antiporter [Nocardioides cavernae]|uniref:NhaP-type Na+/H+ or K+/H+ antiporter n=1 Tax=Nocardioides cavernae TaxID=1921566 RepID=A0A7Y9GZW7_9ACTN|nr:cation:proton antiporter [Nocardioides cavernae]NYE35357.1 NhaP-type Na+/H+ or K+/H+ antiporter [Nocardioides cavernae]